jgi:hypothetical protein
VKNEGKTQELEKMEEKPNPVRRVGSWIRLFNWNVAITTSENK